MSENDQPYSTNWESYTLVGLLGGTHSVERRSSPWDEVFQEIKPVCPKCKTVLTPAELV